MIRGMGILVGLALVIAGIGQAIVRDWTIDGAFLLMVGVGALLLLLAAMTAYEATVGADPPQPPPATPHH